MRYLTKQELIALILSGAGIVAIIIGIILKWWELGAVLNYVLDAIIVGILGVLAWGFYKRILGRSEISSQPSINKSKLAQFNLSLEIGSADFVDINKIWHYHSRDRINFPVFMRQARKKIRMSALTFSLLTLQHESLLRELANDGIKLTFLILDPNSDEAKRQTSLYRSSNNLIDQINSALTRLCELKRRYPKNIYIKKYTQLIGNSITILDDSIIKIEEHVVDSGPNDRENLVIFIKDSKKDFSNYQKQFKDLEKSSTEHQCQSA